MGNNAGVVDIKKETTKKEVHPTDIRVRPHIAYLDLLKRYGLLQLAIDGTLPKDVERSVKWENACNLVKKHGKEKVRVFKNTEGDITISVDADGKDLEQAEVNDYIKHYGMERLVRSMDLAEITRQINRGSKYEIRKGYFLNRRVLVRGIDKDIFGTEWHENYNHPLCEKHLYRVQKDGLPMRGKTYVCKLLDEKRDVLIHESEIGIHII